MLQSLELENFKAFGERAHIPFAPITLIFGENSAGKSSILQALNLLKQTQESRETGAPLLPRTENGIVDLGSFQEMIFDHDLEQKILIRVKTTMDRREMLRLPYRENEIAIEFSFERPSLEEEIRLDYIEIYYGNISKRIAKFQPLDPTERSKEFSQRTPFFRDMFFRDPRSFSPSKLTALKCVWLTEETEYWEHEFKWFTENKDIIFKRVEERLEDLTDSNEVLQEDNNRIREELNSLEKDSFDLEAYISKRSSEEMNTVLGIQGFLPIRIMSNRRNSWITVLRPSELRRAKIFDVGQLAGAAGQALERTLEALFPMGPFRRPPERWYIFRGTSPQDVGYRGDLLPDLLFRRRDLVKESNEWLKRLEMGYELKVEPVGTYSGDLFEMRLIDTRRKEPVNVALPDVGYGISQLLPFVVQSLVSEEQIISIEQPEVHVHPRLQADLGDLLAKAIESDNQFIVETHSEHLVLRLQRLVREKEIKPEDISIIYVSRGPEGAEVQRLHLDEKGYFINDWPGGFFPERLNELR